MPYVRRLDPAIADLLNRRAAHYSGRAWSGASLQVGAERPARLDLSLPILALKAPGRGAPWSEFGDDLLAYVFDTQHWHHQFRDADSRIGFCAETRVATVAIRTELISVMRNQPLVQRIDEAISKIDDQVDDDALEASLLKVPTHGTLALLLSSERDRRTSVLVVMAPRSFKSIVPGKFYREGAEFLRQLRGELGGGLKFD